MTVNIENMQVEENEFGTELLARVEAIEAIEATVNITESNEIKRPTVEIHQINQLGRVELRFSKNMYTRFLSEINEPDRNLQSTDECLTNSTNFDDYWQCVTSQILSIELIQPDGYDIQRDIQFNWTIIEYTGRVLIFQIEFFNAILVSPNQDADTLEIQFLTEDFFYDLSGLPVK